MRELIFSDVYKASRILKKLDVKVDMEKQIPVSLDGNIVNKTVTKSQDEVGKEIIFKIAENLDRARTEISDFIGGLCGMTAEEFENLPLTKAQELMEEFKKLESTKGFFAAVGKLMK